MPTPRSMSDDADFLPPETVIYATANELAAAVRQQLERGITPIEDLRLLILTRLHQGSTQREIEDELASWGLDGRYAVDLVCSVRTAGNFGVVEVRTDLVVGQMVAGTWNNPNYEPMRRLTARAERLNLEARRLAGLELPAEDKGPVELGFEPALPSRSTPGARKGRRRRLMLALLITLVLVALALMLKL